MANFKPSDRVTMIEGNLSPHLKFLDILELEYFRITNKITPIERNSIITEILSLPIYWFDPSNYIFSRNPRLECWF
jgi:hypothetical protein